MTTNNDVDCLFIYQEFAELIQELVHSESKIVYLPATTDDPHKRKPDITVAQRELSWNPKWKVRDGLMKTIEYFRKELEETGEITRTGPNAARPKTNQVEQQP